MKKILFKTLLLSLGMLMQYKIVYASNGISHLQNFLNSYVVGAGQIVCIIGAVEIILSFVSSSVDKKINGLKLFGSGLVMTSINSIINTIFK